MILRHYSLRIFTAVTVASACGFIVANMVFNHPPLFFIEFEGEFHAAEFLLFALEGLACGLLAVVFMKLLKAAGKFANQLSIPAACKPMLAGFVLGVIALQIPEAEFQYGPLVYLGTMVGQITNRLKLGVRDIRSTAIACGVAAAIATA